MFKLYSDKLFNVLSYVLFIVYFGLLIWIISFKWNSYDAIEGTYFLFIDKSIGDRIDYLFTKAFSNFVFSKGTFIDDVCNMFIFIPFGFFIAHFIKNKKIWKVICISFLLSLTFELIQFFTMIGSFSFNDLITNTLGGILGYLFYLLFLKVKKYNLFMLFFNIFFIILIIAFTPLLVYAIINTIKNIDMYKDVIFRVDIFK